MENKITRRSLLKIGFGTAIAAAASTAKALTDRCESTPAQTEGPFYPVKAQDDVDSDLTFVKNGTSHAKGETVLLEGIVQDEQCRPVSGALVEIWQACWSGRYNHPGDAGSNNPLDENFQYWGTSLSDASGRYSFKTILPGAYLAAPGWTRPPHIHFKIARRGFHELITQMYFAGQKYNDTDKILQALDPAEQEHVIVEFKKNEKGELSGRFDVTLIEVR